MTSRFYINKLNGFILYLVLQDDVKAKQNSHLFEYIT